MRLARDVRAFYLRSCAGGIEENGVGEFRIFWDFWVGRAGAKNFRFLGKFEFFGFQKGCRSLHILF